MGVRGRGGRSGDRAELRVGPGGLLQSAISGEYVHGTGDRHSALEILRDGYRALGADLAAPELALSPLAISGRAAIAAWMLFLERQDESTLIRWATDWSAYQAWWERLRTLRETLAAAGVPLVSPPPPALPKTIWQRGEDGTGSKVDAALSLGRTSAFAVMTGMGVWGLVAALRSLRELHLLAKVA